MSLLDLYADRIDQSLQRDLMRPSPSSGEQSFSAWSFGAAGMKGVPRGGLQGTASIVDLLSGYGTVAAAVGGGRDMFGGEIVPGAAQQEEQAHKQMLDGKVFDFTMGNELRRKANEFAPPETAHRADQVINGVAAGVTKAATAISLAGPVAGGAIFGAEEANTTYHELREKGIDHETALKVSGVIGVVSGVTAGVPAGGSTVLKSLGIATAAGPAAFVTQESAARKILADAGYKDEASLHNPLDPLGLVLSTLIPYAAAGVHVARLPKAPAATGPIKTEADVKQAVQLNPAEQARSDAYERSAVNIRELQAAIATEKRPDAKSALEAELATQQGEARKHAGEATMRYAASDPAVVDAARVHVTTDALQRSLPPHEGAYQEVVNAADQVAAGKRPVAEPGGEHGRIESALAKKLEDHEAAAAEYSRLPDSEGGKVLNTDIARELSPDYLKDRTQSAAVHEPASAFVKRLYAEKLAALKPGDEVMFTSGGTGAGKTSAIEGVGAIAAMKDAAAIIYDTNMNTLSSAVSKIEQALKAGADVSIVHVQRDPVDALVNGALPRAVRQEQKYGTGRTVPLHEHARTHQGAAEVIQQLAEKYADNPHVAIHVIDNTRGRGGAAVTDLGFVRSFDYTGLEGKLNEALKQQRDAGAISEAIFRGTQGHAVQATFRPVRGNDGPEPALADRTERPGAERAGQGRVGNEASTAEARPEAARVDRLAEETPNLSVRLPGSDETLPLTEALRRVREEADLEAKEAGLLEAAMKCVLG